MNSTFHPAPPLRPFRSGAASFLIAGSAIGSLLIAATSRGVCAILPGDDPDRLVRELRGRCPDATPDTGNPALRRLAERAVRLVEGGAVEALPLDPRGTRFERRVWDAIAGIPSGTVASYADLAGRIGAPGSTRAVARACASNAIAVAIPCHRVVRSDGGLGGYRWGLTLKRDLLAREAAA